MTFGISKRHLSTSGAGSGAASSPDPDSLLDWFKRTIDCADPWRIEQLSVPADDSQYDVWLFHTAEDWPCPRCRRTCVSEGRTSELVFRCLTSVTPTYVHVRLPIVDCDVHGRQPVRTPWTDDPTKWTREV